MYPFSSNRHTGSISLCVDLFVFICVYFVSFVVLLFQSDRSVP